MAHLSIELIERFAMRELSDGELQRVNKHTATCRECEERLEVEIAQMAEVRSWRARSREILKSEKKNTAKR